MTARSRASYHAEPLVTLAQRLQAILILTDAIARDPRPADAVVSAWARAERRVGEADRGEIVEQTYAILRHQARLGWWLQTCGRASTPRHRLLAWVVLGMGRTAEQASALFNGRAGAPDPLDADEHGLVTRLQGGSLDHPSIPEAVRAECPAWAEGPLRRRFGEAFATEMAAMLAAPSLDLRVNPLKTTREAVLGQLAALRLPAEPCPFAPFGVRLAKRPALGRLPMLRNGEAEIQDEGSQLVAALVDARPGDRVVDFCAGAGGKSLALATQMAGKGLLVACDVSEGRLRRAAERFRQAGAHNVQTRLLASERDKWVKRHKGGFDRVLVDAPCSGTGAWRRNPDARWRTEGAGLAALIALQAAILDSAARLVRPGGRLVYATCSLLIEENEAQVDDFLAAHPEFRATPLAEAAPGLAALGAGERLLLTPARHGTDGFFAAAMTRAG